uniref:Uncharacterized protein LOC111109159 n=1 Tax=Crassostrea virginica TaxID=6565 RepID=A0A8B8BD77_CRAVI|nr:uncharacterized protein LOC111109159 [Crassostrea virginica]
MDGDQKDIIRRNKAIIHKNWGVIKKQLIVEDVIDTLIEKGVVAVDTWMEMKKKKSEKDKVEELMSILLMQPNYIPIFQKALKKTKNCLAKELEFHGDVDSSENCTSLDTVERNDNDNPSGNSSAGDYLLKSDFEDKVNSMQNDYAMLMQEVMEVMRQNRATMDQTQEAFKEIKDELKIFKEFKKKQEVLNDRFCKQLSTTYGNESGIEEMKRQHEELLKENKGLKETLQKLPIVSAQKAEIEKDLEKKRSETKALHEENKSLKEERDKLLADLLRLETDLNNAMAKLQSPEQQQLILDTEVERNRIKNILSTWFTPPQRIFAVSPLYKGMLCLIYLTLAYQLNKATYSFLELHIRLFIQILSSCRQYSINFNATSLIDLLENTNRERKQRRWWTRDWLLLRTIHGQYEALMAELRLEKPEEFKKCANVSGTSPCLRDADTKMSPTEKMSPTGKNDNSD